MKIEINIEKRHAYTLTAFLTVILSIVLVNAFGGSNPAVVGHSAAELIVNSTSIVDGSVTGTDIDESTLTCTAIPGLSASLCDGSDQDTDTDSRCDTTTCGAISSSSSFDLTTSSGTDIQNGNGATTVFGTGISSGQNTDVGSGRVNGFNGLMSGSTLRIDGSGNLVNIGSISASSDISTSGGTISSGGNVVRRATGCPSFNYLTTDAVQAVGCGGITDTGLRVD